MSSPQPIKTYQWRLRIMMLFLVTVALFLAWRAMNIQVLNNTFLQGQGDARFMRDIALPAHRGMILDRNGEALAVSTPVSSVWANPQAVPLHDARLVKLASILEVPVSQLKRDLFKRKDKEFVYLKRQIDPVDAQRVKLLDLPGISLQREFRRYYPMGEVASHVLGFTNVDDDGQEGLELAYDANLRGQPGKQKVIKDRLGHIVDSIDLLESPQPGLDMQLSIDRRLQYVAYKELKNAVVKHKATSGSVVLLDARTNEILAMVNQPSYNPNNRKGLHAQVLRNRAVTDLFEPGSTFKPFTVAVALNSKKFNPHTLIDTTPGTMRIGPNQIKDAHNYGLIDVSRVIQKSSNVGVTKMALALPKQSLWETFSDVGFGEISGSGFPGEVSGSLPFFGEWNDIEQATLSFGYGVAVTPLQLAQAYAVIANGGYIKHTSFNRGGSSDEGRRVMSEEISKQLRAMLEKVVSEDGTGLEASVSGYRIAGKTGTVKKPVKGGYIGDKYFAVFAGMAPANNPRFVAVVMIDEPNNGDYYGGKVAAPVFSAIMSAALRMMNVAPDATGREPMRMATVVDQ